MPNINDLLFPPGTEETDFLSDLDSEVQGLLGGMTPDPSVAADPAAQQTAPDGGDPSTPLPGEGDDVGGGGANVSVAESPPPPAPSQPTDVWSTIPEAQKARLIALDAAITADPQTFARAVAPPPPVIEQPVPRLPEHVDPTSFEADLWRGQQEQNRALQEIAAATRQTQQVAERQRADSIANRAASDFGARHGLAPDDLMAVAQHAGASGLAGQLTASANTDADLYRAYQTAMETSLWSTPELRAKVIPTEAPTPPAETPEAIARKRNLTALSGAASPVAGPATKPPPVRTGRDGKIVENDRQALIREAANKIARSQSGTF